MRRARDERGRGQHWRFECVEVERSLRACHAAVTNVYLPQKTTRRRTPNHDEEIKYESCEHLLGALFIRR